MILPDRAAAAVPAVVVRVAGEATLDTADAIRHAMSEATSADAIPWADTSDPGRRATRLVVDLTAVTFIDSTGLGVLVSGLRHMRRRGGTVELVVKDERVLTIFRITGLLQAFTVHRTLEDATRA